MFRVCVCVACVRECVTRREIKVYLGMSLFLLLLLLLLLSKAFKNQSLAVFCPKNILFCNAFFKNLSFFNGFSHIFENRSNIHLKTLLKVLLKGDRCDDCDGGADDDEDVGG